MRISPLIMGFLYGGFAFIFVYLAIQSPEEDIWNFTTILLMLLATFNFVSAIRFFMLDYKIRKITKKNDDE